MKTDQNKKSPATTATPVLSFESHLGRFVGNPGQPAGPITLRGYYESFILPDIAHQAPASLVEDRGALRNWELHTGDPDIRAIGKVHLAMLRDGMAAAGRSPATINKAWREIKAMLQVAAEEGVINRVPRIGIGMKSALVRAPAKRQRELVTSDELTRLWHACGFATYPNPRRYPSAQIWRSLLLFLWLYGPRTRDLFRLRWESVLIGSRMIRFEAMKTRKLQALPLTELACNHIEALRDVHPEFVFGPMLTTGAFRPATKSWDRGYYSTWRTEIQPAARIEEPIQFKHFRESMVSNLNGIEPALGNWIAGHYMPGVSNQHYDMPTRRIRRAIEEVEVPDCFHSIGGDS